jgi:hypothetical protein
MTYTNSNRYVVEDSSRPMGTSVSRVEAGKRYRQSKREYTTTVEEAIKIAGLE